MTIPKSSPAMKKANQGPENGFKNMKFKNLDLVESSKYAYKYRLFLYRNKKKKSDIFKPNAYRPIVIYIPGSMGHFGQVRSLGGTASASGDVNRFSRFSNIITNNYFDFYALDFNEELSVLDSRLIKDQTLFLQDVLKYLENLYRFEKDEETNKIVLVGHSMGGLVARNLMRILSKQSIKKYNIISVISLSSPTRFPRVSLDSKFVNLYSKILNFEKQKTGNTPFYLSISGGLKDLQIPSLFSKFTATGDNFHSITIGNHYDTRLSYINCDHLSILWCKQFLNKLVDGLYHSSHVQVFNQAKDLGAKKVNYKMDARPKDLGHDPNKLYPKAENETLEIDLNEANQDDEPPQERLEYFTYCAEIVDDVDSCNNLFREVKASYEEEGVHGINAEKFGQRASIVEDMEKMQHGSVRKLAIGDEAMTAMSKYLRQSYFLQGAHQELNNNFLAEKENVFFATVVLFGFFFCIFSFSKTSTPMKWSRLNTMKRKTAEKKEDEEHHDIVAKTFEGGEEVVEAEVVIDNKTGRVILRFKDTVYLYNSKIVGASQVDSIGEIEYIKKSDDAVELFQEGKILENFLCRKVTEYSPRLDKLVQSEAIPAFWVLVCLAPLNNFLALEVVALLMLFWIVRLIIYGVEFDEVTRIEYRKPQSEK
eukprot:augustus_masked-scaffold_13-processed-gene-2.17-mRNA-1 protein AED:0.99 eAED:1.00 QI:0/0/0/0.5/1/1/2/0/649